MSRITAFLIFILLVQISRSERVNKTVSGGLLSSSGEGHVVGNPETDESLNDHDELDGGFPSLEGMLQWAIGHSDPAKLELKAHDAKKLSTDELQKRQKELQELVEKLETPSDAKLMRIAIDNLNNPFLSWEDRHRTLGELSMLVEDIENAIYLHKMGGLSVVLKDLNNSDHWIRMTSVSIVAKASQNNPIVQNQVVNLGALPKLMMMVKSDFDPEAIKALHAVSAVIRNNEIGIKLFNTEGGEKLLQGILSNATADVRLHKRSVSLIADLAEYQLDNSSKLQIPFFRNCALVRLVIDLTPDNDLDLQEKVLLAVKNLLMLKSTEHLIVDGFCGLEGALVRMRKQLQPFILDEDVYEYATEVERLCKEVNSIYNEKLNKGSQVPT
ncbi:hsp70 nucleotide exchange factor FES1 [Rutidosis leptorrhynchoides]|uniref:hsp70 nucleotide exchange factor FES1 n=1 Tax=Rutidosis leptorrhynchoides TaxID=125765 RepID=UPI003A9A02A7